MEVVEEIDITLFLIKSDLPRRTNLCKKCLFRSDDDNNNCQRPSEIEDCGEFHFYTLDPENY